MKFRLGFALVFGAIAACSNAYDTGHHANLTRSAMWDEGFSVDARDSVIVYNWLTDYFSNSPTAGLKPHLGKLHFDNLFSTQEVANYWGRLVQNTAAACKAYGKAGDILSLLAIMGMSLHAVQDFYTHSNWIDYYPQCPDGGLHTVTWFDDPDRVKKAVYTGGYPSDPVPTGAIELHGAYFDGLNKDSYFNPYWMNGYVAAYKASRQWIKAMRSWFNNEPRWLAMLGYTITNVNLRNELNADLEATYGISAWVLLPVGPHRHDFAHGKWKGYGSGDAALFAELFGRWGPSTSFFQAAFTARNTHRKLTDGLRGDLPPTAAPTPPPAFAVGARGVFVRTKFVAEQPGGRGDPPADPFTNPDYRGSVSFNGFEFIEATQVNSRYVEPAWNSVEFYKNAYQTAKIEYWLYDEDLGPFSADDLVDIHPTVAKYNAAFNIDLGTSRMSGDIVGLHNTPATAAVLGGVRPDRPRATISLYGGAFPLKDTKCEGYRTVIINIERVLALNNFDGPFGRADFYSRVVGPVHDAGTMYILDNNDARPMWFLRWQIPNGVHSFELSIFDQDGVEPWPNPTTDDQADINPKAGRSLSFKVDTLNGKVSGDVAGAVGGAFVVRGNTSPRAEVTFRVIVR